MHIAHACFSFTCVTRREKFSDEIIHRKIARKKTESSAKWKTANRCLQIKLENMKNFRHFLGRHTTYGGTANIHGILQHLFGSIYLQMVELRDAHVARKKNDKTYSAVHLDFPSSIFSFAPFWKIRTDDVNHYYYCCFCHSLQTNKQTQSKRAIFSSQLIVHVQQLLCIMFELWIVDNKTKSKSLNRRWNIFISSDVSFKMCTHTALCKCNARTFVST